MNRDRGSVAVELTLLTPLLLLFLMFVVFGGRMTRARLVVDGAAADAARAASVARSIAGARVRASDAAATSLSEQGLTCEGFDVAVDATEFRPGGSVSVTVRCTVSLADLSGLRLPGTETVERTSTAPIDTFRGAST